MLFWHVPAPNEALLISGSKSQAQETQFRIVTGHGGFVLPIKQKARILSLALREAEIVEECVTNQGIRLNVRAVSVFKVGDDPVSIANAARRFLADAPWMFLAPSAAIIFCTLSLHFIADGLRDWMDPRSRRR